MDKKYLRGEGGGEMWTGEILPPHNMSAGIMSLNSNSLCMACNRYGLLRILSMLSNQFTLFSMLRYCSFGVS